MITTEESRSRLYSYADSLAYAYERGGSVREIEEWHVMGRAAEECAKRMFGEEWCRDRVVLK